MPTREDFQLLLQLDQACKFGKDAKKFVWSDAASGENGGHAFFEKYGWDSDERMYVNEVATYYETCADAWLHGFITDEAYFFDWAPAVFYWEKLSSVLLAAREILEEPRLWSGFEAFAAAQSAAATAQSADESEG